VFNSKRRSPGKYHFAGYKLCDANVRAAFSEAVEESIAPLWDKDMAVIGKWDVLRDRVLTLHNH